MEYIVFDSFYFFSVVGSRQNWAESNIEIYVCPCTHVPTVRIINTHPSRVVASLQSMNLYLHIFITQSPWFTLGFTLGAIHSMSLDKCTQAYRVLLHFALLCFTDTVFPTNWRFVATLEWANLLVLFFFPTTFAHYLSDTFWQFLKYFKLSQYYYGWCGDLWPVIFDVTTTTHWSFRR